MIQNFVRSTCCRPLCDPQEGEIDWNRYTEAAKPVGIPRRFIGIKLTSSCSRTKQEQSRASGNSAVSIHKNQSTNTIKRPYSHHAEAKRHTYIELFTVSKNSNINRLSLGQREGSQYLSLMRRQRISPDPRKVLDSSQPTTQFKDSPKRDVAEDPNCSNNHKNMTIDQAQPIAFSTQKKSISFQKHPMQTVSKYTSSNGSRLIVHNHEQSDQEMRVRRLLEIGSSYSKSESIRMSLSNTATLLDEPSSNQKKDTCPTQVYLRKSLDEASRIQKYRHNSYGGVPHRVINLK